ncbi:mitofusin [Spizellomyces punctatus DAOM BR117]|uniref:Dynamin-type G domain-containing protein n=1 Tax=Spizellomyces punctatus (strain DAOM BR117) TaxID=645134 RepID=A0A0L0HUF5_SPIPD|nr:mitofusin [Spizellomyces punctatus DAOM BR117]KND04717.1 hypothetical protein SPPG_00426 [Spizellomyces punctatus DAOM BR117]|eukprot:XP_016612756.1 hypothetical protein SPPG_00426 [Spizellomyces punctatus DAOM BR117]
MSQVYVTPEPAPSDTPEATTTKQATHEPQFLKTDSAKSFSTTNGFGVDSGYGGEHSQAIFAEKRTRLLTLIAGTKGVLRDLVGPTGTVSHTLRYPSGALRKAFGSKPPTRRTSSTEDDSQPPASPIPVAAEPPTDSVTQGLRVLQLDLKSYSFKGPASQIDSDDHSLISQLLESKIIECRQHLDRLNARISDTRSRVLVTGDLNAGKSTFVNAVLRREIVPDDQQPCTALFAEVVDADQNDGVEEVHGIRDPIKYDRSDPTTFERFDFRNLRHVVEDNEEDYELLRIYCRDRRAKTHSLLHNGVVDISLIDSPGLNIDSIKTTALFSQQEEIDVIVFVVNAENHFTLSGRDFLTTAGKEKAYIFIVVNRFDQIRRKDRCRRDILEQIRQISPATYDDADNLVHFVSAKECLHHPEGADAAGTMVPDFHKMEEALRSFILEKRARSKLAPAKIYLHNLLSDVMDISQYNSLASANTATQIMKDMKDSAPAYDRMVQIKEQVLDDIDKTIDETGLLVQQHAQQQLAQFTDHLDAFTEHVEWNGPLYVWQYARDLRNRVYSIAALRVRRCEEFARDKAISCLKDIESVAATCMSVPPSIDVDVVTGAFEGDVGSAPGSKALAGNGSVAKIVPMDVAEFFDHIDKAELAKEYVPSLGLIIGGLVGYKRMATQMWRAGMSGASTGRLAFAGLTIAGIGIFLYVLSDMKNSVERKVVRKMREHFTEVGFVESNVDRVAKGTRRVLRLAIWEFQNQFQRILTENQRKRENQMRSIELARADKAFYDDMAYRAAELVREVDAIDLEEKMVV